MEGVVEQELKKFGSPHLGAWLLSVAPAERAEGKELHLQEDR